jgi:hypothetical protein
MAWQPRPHRLLVKLTDAEHEALHARAHAEGVPMATVLRAGIDAPDRDRHPAQEDETVAPTLSEADLLGIIETASSRGSWQAARWLLERIDRRPSLADQSDPLASVIELAKRRERRRD